MSSTPIDLPSLANSAFQALPMPVAIVDVHGVIVSVNTAWRQMMTESGEWDVADPVGTYYFDICEEAAGPQKQLHADIEEAMQRVLQGGLNQFIHGYAVRHNGEERPYQIIIHALASPGAVILHQDQGPATASGRHRAIRAKERDETVPRLAEHAPVLIWTSDENGQSQWFNKRWLDFCQKNLDEALASDWRLNIHPDDYNRVIKTVTEASKDKTDYMHRFRMKRADGEYRWLQERGQPLRHPDGKFAGYIGSCTDVSDIMRTERELSQHRDHLHRQLQFSGALNRMSQTVIANEDPDNILPQLLEITGRSLAVDSIVVLDVGLAEQKAGIISQWNLTGEINEDSKTSFGLNLFSESLRHAWEMRTPLESHADQINPRFVSEGSAAIIHEKLTIRSLLWVPFSFRTEGFLVLGIHQTTRQRNWIADEREFVSSVGNLVNLALQKARMLRERKESAMQLLQAGKMEAMSRLAGGIAHDYNNLLTVISGHANLLQRALPNGHPLRVHADTIMQTADRAAETTKHLLSFSRRQPITSTVINPNKIIERLRILLDRLIPENIIIQTDLIADIGHVAGDPGQLELALMNFCINARDAMKNGGRLTLISREVTVEAELGRRNGVMPGVYITLSVRDNGIGMNEKTVDRLFEPFFTTKAQGKGTGLGLSSAYGTVRSMNGFIQVESQENNGTTMSIYLPKVQQDAHDILTPIRLAALGGTETILLVEDNSTILELTRDALVNQGYRVMAASDGNEAIRLAQEQSQKIDLLLTDLVLPDLGGESLAVRLRTVYPNLKIIISSGYATDAFSLNMDIPHIGFLAKPYTIDELIRMVRHAIDTPQT